MRGPWNTYIAHRKWQFLAINKLVSYYLNNDTEKRQKKLLTCQQIANINNIKVNKTMSMQTSFISQFAQSKTGKIENLFYFFQIYVN